ncbi:hypothetical protein KAR48_20085 [bacterium]|nr:hypothetical protein [bacterium]
MSIVKVAQLVEGMQVIHPVINHRGQVIIEAGQCITAKHLRIFRMWGVTEVNIQGDKGKADPDIVINNIPQEIIDNARTHVKNRFCHTDFKHPAIRALAKINLNATIQYLMKETAHE